MTVRIAGPDDEDAIFRLLERLAADNSIGFPYHEDQVRRSIRIGTERKAGLVAVVETPDKQIVGSVGLHWAQPWYSNDWFVHEVWLFVDPAYRKGTGYADALMRWVQGVKERGDASTGRKTPFFTSVSSRKRLAAKMRWWGRRGEMIGAIYLLR